MTSVGSVSVRVVPDASDFVSSIRRQLDDVSKSLGGRVGKNIGESIDDGLSKSVDNALKDVDRTIDRTGERAGKDYSKGFAGEFRKNLQKVFSEFAGGQDFKVGPDIDEKAVNKLRAKLADLTGDRVDFVVEVDADTTRARQKIEELEAKLQHLSRESANVSISVTSYMAERELDAFAAAANALGRMRPTVTVDVDSTAAQAKLQSLKDRVDNLGRATPTITPDADTFVAQIKLQFLESQAKALAKLNPTITVDADTSAASAKIAALVAEVNRLNGSNASVKIDIDAETTGARAAIDAIAQHARGLNNINPTIKVDADTFVANIKMQFLANQARALGAMTPTITANANTTFANTQFLTLLAVVNQLNGQNVTLQAQVHGLTQTVAGLAQVRAAAAAANGQNVSVDTRVQGNIIPILGGILALVGAIAAATPAAAAALAGLGAGVSALGQGLGAAVMGFSGIGDAIKAVNQDQERAAEASTKTAKTSTSNANAIANAQAGVAAAVQNAARQQVQGAQQIADAQSGVVSAQRAAERQALSSAEGITSAQNQVTQAVRAQERQQITSAQSIARAQESVANAVRQADRGAIQSAQQVASARRSVADAVRAAAEGVANAERSVTRAQLSARNAQEDLTRSRKEAAEQLEDLQLALSGTAISEQRALYNVQKAQQELASGMAAGKAGLDAWDLRLNVSEAVQGLAEVRERMGDLQVERADFNRTGIEGSRGVVSAQQAMQDSLTGVAEAQRGLATAQSTGQRQIADATSNLARAQQQAGWQAEDSARAVQAAQRGVADAVQSAGWAQEDAARAVADAQRGVQKAMRDAGLQQQDSAEAIAKAQQGVERAVQSAAWAQQDAARGVENAQRSLQQAMESSAAAAGTNAASLAKSGDELAKLSNAGRSFVDFWTKELQPAMQRLSGEISEAMLPNVEAGLRNLINLQPGIRAAFINSGRIMGEVFKTWTDFISTPETQNQIQRIMATNNGLLRIFGDVANDAFAILLDLVEAGGPVMERMGRAIRDVFQYWRDWVDTASRSGYLADLFKRWGDEGAFVWDILIRVARAVLDLAFALAPLGNFLLVVVGYLADFISYMSETHPIITLVAGALFVATAALVGLGNVLQRVSLALTGKAVPGGLRGVGYALGLVKTNANGANGPLATTAATTTKAGKAAQTAAGHVNALNTATQGIKPTWAQTFVQGAQRGEQNVMNMQRSLAAVPGIAESASTRAGQSIQKYLSQAIYGAQDAARGLAATTSSAASRVGQAWSSSTERVATGLYRVQQLGASAYQGLQRGAIQAGQAWRDYTERFSRNIDILNNGLTSANGRMIDLRNQPDAFANQSASARGFTGVLEATRGVMGRARDSAVDLGVRGALGFYDFAQKAGDAGTRVADSARSMGTVARDSVDSVMTPALQRATQQVLGFGGQSRGLGDDMRIGTQVASNAVGSMAGVIGGHLRNAGSGVMGFARDTVGGAVRALGTGVQGLGQIAGGVGATISRGLLGAKVEVDGVSQRMGGLVGALGGPWGLAITAATVGVGLFADSMQKSAQRAAEQRQAIQDVKGTLDEYSGAVTNATIADQARRNATDVLAGSTKTAADVARQYGVDLHDLALAQSGNADALGRVNGALGAQAQAFITSRPGAQSYIDDFARMGITLSDLNGYALGSVESQEKIGAALRGIAADSPQGAEALQGFLSSVREGTTDMSALGRSIGGANDNLRNASKQWLETKAGIGALQTSLDPVSASFNTLGQSALDAQGNVSGAGQIYDQLRGQLAGVGGAARDSALAAGELARRNGEAGGAATGAARSLQASRQAFIQTATDAGLTADQAGHLADTMGLIPSLVTTSFNTLGVAQVDQALGLLSGKIASVNTADGTIHLSAPLAPQVMGQLDQLGLKVVTLPDGKQIVISANRAPADLSIDGITARVNSMTAVMRLDGDPLPANATLDQVVERINAARGAAHIEGDPLPANATVLQTVDWINRQWGTLNAGANSEPAGTDISGRIAWINGRWAAIPTNANTDPARDGINGFIQWVNTIPPNLGPVLKVNADAGQAYTAIDNLYKAANGRVAVAPLSPGGRARGGIDFVRGMAAGGMRTMKAGLANVVGPNTPTLIGDRKKDDEAYIPLNSSGRSADILSAAAGQMGYSVIPMAAGGVRKDGATAAVASAAPAAKAAAAPAAAPAAASAAAPAAAGGVALDPAVILAVNAALTAQITILTQLTPLVVANTTAVTAWQAAETLLATTTTAILLPALTALQVAELALDFATQQTALNLALATAGMGLSLTTLALTAQIQLGVLGLALTNVQLATTATALNMGMNAAAMGLALTTLAITGGLQLGALQLAETNTQLQTNATALNMAINTAGMVASLAGLALNAQIQFGLLQTAELNTRIQTDLTAQNLAMNAANMSNTFANLATTATFQLSLVDQAWQRTAQGTLDSVVRMSTDMQNFMNFTSGMFVPAINGALGVVANSFAVFRDAVGARIGELNANVSTQIRWLITTPLGNPGLVGAYNKLNTDFGLNKPVTAYAPGFASGGPIPGTGSGTADNVPIMASAGEFMVREKIARQHTPFLRALNAGQAEARQAAGGARARMPGYNPRGYAEGGIIAAVERAKAFAQGENGKPYQWGGAGNPSWDCSGFMGAITRVLRGQTPGRIGSTGDFPWGGFTPGLTGSFAVGSTPNHANSGIGHMAGTLGGVNVESAGSGKGVHFGPPALGADAGIFNVQASLGEVGGQFVSGGAGGGAMFDPTPMVEEAFKETYRLLNEEYPARFGQSVTASIPQGIGTQTVDGAKGKVLEKLMAMFATSGAMGGLGAGAPFYVAEIARAAKLMGLGRDGAVLGVATALVESDLRMMASPADPGSEAFPHDVVSVDHTSSGLFQQQAFPEWGNVQQRMNAFGSAVMFFEHLVRMAPWWRTNMGPAAQAVQRSAFPDKYAQRIPQATGLVAQYGGAFDSGGLASGTGYMPKMTPKPERVLSPQQTRSFDTLVRHADQGDLYVGSSFGDLEGLEISGRLEFDADGHQRLVDGRIEAARVATATRVRNGRRT